MLPVLPIDIQAPGHFVGAKDCRFYRHTHVGRYCISSVGGYRPLGANAEDEEIGHRRTHETFVFDLSRDESGDRWLEIDARHSNSDVECAEDHEEMVRKYLKKCTFGG